MFQEEAEARDVANMLIKGADVVVADEAHVLKASIHCDSLDPSKSPFTHFGTMSESDQLPAS